MGCIQGSNENYFEYSKNDEEKHFREWEKSLGCFRTNFSALFGLLISDERVLSNYQVVKATIVRNYNEKFLSILENPYFQAEGKSNKFNSRRLQSLIFLTTIHILQSSDGKTYCDKASFLFNIINKDEELNANSPIERNNSNLVDLITEFYEISAIIMAETYLKSQHGREEVYRKLSDNENKKDIVENILTELFKDKSGKEINCLTFDEFNSVFVRNKNVSLFFNLNIQFNINLVLFFRLF